MSLALLGVAHGAGLTDDGDLHLTWVGHLVLDALSDLGRECGDRVVVGILCPYDDTELTSGLDSIGLHDAGVGEGELL